MASINISAVGATGLHTLARTNVNLEGDFLYFLAPSVGQPTIPTQFQQNNQAYVYRNGVGVLSGVTNESLVYIRSLDANSIQLSTTSGGSSINITGVTSGTTTWNRPEVFNNQLNIDSSTPTNQAVKYFTAGDPLTGLVSGNTYFLKNVDISGFAGSQALYTIASNTHTFTTCGQTGRVGPTQVQMRSAYDTSANGNWDETYISVGNFQGYQDWTVPVSGVYQFTVSGASGYNGNGAGGVGRGAVVRGRVTLTKGEIITIAVGQVGSAPNSGSTWGGSGGGTFVVRKTGSEPLFVAGGGSAESGAGAGRDGVTTSLGGFSTAGVAAGGALGFGGLGSGGRSAGGGGFLGAGIGADGNIGGGGFNNGLVHAANGRVGGFGGFGGGGQSDGQSAGQSGGAGGYSGGGGARTTTPNQSGGGGGSYITPVATNVATSNGLYDTSSIFNGAAITPLNTYNTGEGSVVMSIISSFTSGNEVYPTAVDSDAGTNKIEIEPAGSSYHAFVPIDFDLQNDRIYNAATHGLISGEAVVLNFNGTSPTGITNGTIYYVNKVNNWAYSLSTTPSPTFTTINLTTPSSRETGTSSTLSKVIVNTSTDTLTINNHGFLVDQPIKYDVGGGTPIEPLQDQATYFVAEVLNANQIRLKVSLNAPLPINFTAAGTGTAHSFIFVTVNPDEDTLYIPNHGLVSGQAVRYSNGGGTTIPGLTNNTTYYIIKVDNSIVKLSPNKALTPVANITGPGTGTQSLVITSLDYVNNIITVPGHGYLDGELVQYDSRGQTVVAGLTTATPYYVIKVDADNIKLALTPEDAVAGTAIDITDTPAGVGRHTLQSLTQTPDGIYTITSVPTPDTFTVEARGNVPVIVKTFNPRSSLDLNLSAFFLPSHGFTTGTEVTYSQGDAATDIDGLVDNTDYYVVSINRDYIRLAETAEEAASGTTLTVSDFGTGVGHSFTSTQINGNVTGGGTVTIGAGSVLVNGTGTQFSKILKVGDRFRVFPPNTTNAITFAAADVNTTTNRITKAHTFTTGDTVRFSAGGGVSPSPLVNEYYYFVRSVSGTEITLHNSAADASSNSGALDFTTQGTGSAFTLTRTAPAGPIIRRITAIGSDTQITVDRPYASAYNAVGYSYPTFVYVRPEGYSLHRPFDGGVEMSVGTGTSLGQIVRQTRKYFRYQSGKGLQTSCGINFKPSIDIESMERFSPTQVTVTTRRPHGLISGLFVVVSQATDSQGVPSTIYNGTFQVTVVNLRQFRITPSVTVPEGAEAKAYGFPQFYVREWQNGAIRSGMFDFQNGMFFEFDGQEIYAVRRSSTQQMAGTVAAQQGSELIFGTGSKFTAQLDVGDYVVMRGQSYRVTQIDSDTRMSVRPEYKGSSGTEKEFDPATVVNTTTDNFFLIGHGFSDLLPVTYNSIDGEPIGGLINGRTYYVDLVDNNNFKLLASPDAESNVNLSSLGTTDVHSFTPAKSGIIVTKTVDTRVAQGDWSIDPCDGSGPTGYNLDLSRIQMAYIDYSWYGAGKIRFGFKTGDGQVQYVHEFVHNNFLYESYLRSGNLPARYEVVTYDNPTYIPFLFHWGTSVMMDGRFDDDNAYLFTATSQTLTVPGTTAKSYSSSAVNATTNLVTIPSHGFSNGDLVQYEGIATNGLRGQNTQNTAISYTSFAISNKALTSNIATLTTSAAHGFSAGQSVDIRGVDATFNGVYNITGTPTGTTFTYARIADNVTSVEVLETNARASVVSMYNRQANLTNASVYSIYAPTVNTIGLFPPTAGVGEVPGIAVSTSAQTGTTATIVAATPHNLVSGNIVKITGLTRLPDTSLYGVVTVTNTTTFTIVAATTAASPVTAGADTAARVYRLLDITGAGNTQYTYFLYPNGSLNNTSGPNYQPLISLRLSPSVSEGLTGKLGDRDVINRMQLRLKEIGISSTQLLDCKVLLNPRLNNLNFQSVDAPSLTQIVEHTSADTVSGGVQVYNFRAQGGSGGSEESTTVDVSTLFELSNSILGGDSIYPDGPDILTIAVSRLTGSSTLASAKLSWSEAQA
jgi:hypothetical protein